MLEEKNKEQIILDAAEKEFMSKGFDGAKTMVIAAAANVTHAMLHYYFRTKENLFNKVMLAKMLLVKDSILTAFSREDLPLLQRIQNGIEAHFDILALNPDLPRFVMNELISKPAYLAHLKSMMQLISGGVYKNLQKDLKFEQAKGNIEKISIQDLMLDIISLNVFVFMAYPIIETFALEDGRSKEEFLAARKKENVEIIMRRLIKK